MKNKTKNILFALIILVAICTIYFFNYTSTDNQFRRMQNREVLNWYFGGISIERSGLEEFRSNDQKKLMDGLTKARYGLEKDEWYFLTEDISTKEIDSYGQIIDVTQIFKNKNTDDKKYFENRYYYDMNSDKPIPLLEKSFVFNDSGFKSTYSDTIVKTLWDGDFDSICIKPTFDYSSENL